MPNFNQAPELKFNGEKIQDNPKNTYYIPQNLGDIINQKLGNASAQLRLMYVLVGTKEGFKISEKWILERTGLTHKSYITARQALVNRGWITHDAAKGITINFDKIYAENRSNTISPQCDNEKIEVTPFHYNDVTPFHYNRGNTILPIINNIIDNIIDNSSSSDEIEVTPFHYNRGNTILPIINNNIINNNNSSSTKVDEEKVIPEEMINRIIEPYEIKDGYIYLINQQKKYKIVK